MEMEEAKFLECKRDACLNFSDPVIYSLEKQ